MADDFVLVSIGSNIQPEYYVPVVIQLLEDIFGSLQISSIFETSPIGMTGDNFLNLAVKIRTAMPMDALKNDVLRELESRLDRVRTSNKFDPRTIDLDIAVYHGKVIDQDLFKHAHIAVPVAQLAPDIIDPISKTSLAEIARDFIQSNDIKLREGILVARPDGPTNPEI